MWAAQILPDKANQTAINGVVVRKGSVGAFLTSAQGFCSITPLWPKRDPNPSAISSKRCLHYARSDCSTYAKFGMSAYAPWSKDTDGDALQRNSR